MTAAAVLVKLWAAGIELTADGDLLRCRASAGVLTPKVVEAIKAAKQELLPLVETQALAEHGLRRCEGCCGHIQALRWFDGSGEVCDECRGEPDQAELFEA